MFNTLVCAMALTSDAVKEHVVAASIFKNGYALVVREIPVKDSGELVIPELPASTLGSFWITASKGIKIESAVKRIRMEAHDAPVLNLDDLLNAATGTNVKLSINQEDQLTGKTVSGKLLSANDQMVVVQTGEGVLALPRHEVESVETLQPLLKGKYPVQTQVTEAVLKIDTKVSGDVFLYSLEQGLDWTPSYSLDITDPDKISLVAKATVVDENANLDQADVKFVTGFPNVPFLDQQDPFTSDANIQALMTVGFLGRPYSPLANQAPIALKDSITPTGEDMNFSQSFNASAPGMQGEDLFFYSEPACTLHKGERAYYVLFDTTVPYKNLYTLDLPDSVNTNGGPAVLSTTPPDVWHSIRFRDLTKQPFTTAPATVFQKGQIVGQDMLHYTTPGDETEVRMSKALDVHAEANEEETSRERVTIRNPNLMRDLVTIKGTVVIKNFKNDPVEMKITKSVTGQVVDSGSAKVTNVAQALQDLNPHAKIEWNENLKPGESKTISYTYKLYLSPFSS